MSAVERLCPQCGLCCNGVLFGDVELQRPDDATKLAALGFKLQKKGRKQAFRQPCVCFDGRLCTVYAGRPERCRTFECGQIQRVEAGDLTLAQAERHVREVKRLAAEVLRLLRRLGNQDEAAPLNLRYSAVLSQPIDLAGNEDVIDCRGELMMAVGRLVEALERNFLVAGD